MFGIIKDLKNAINYYLKTLEYCSGLADLSTISTISESLSSLFHTSGDFKNALYFKIRATNTRDSILKLAKDRDIALLGVDRETRKHEEELRQEKEHEIKTRDIQYMSITIAISLVFVLMLIIGMFPVSKMTIKILGYFFFISLFEFIVLFLDNEILHYATHGEPLKLWLIKIGLIGLLVPVQHFLEHKLVKFLESRKLLKARTEFSFKKWWNKKKILHPTTEVVMNETSLHQPGINIEKEVPTHAKEVSIDKIVPLRKSEINKEKETPPSDELKIEENAGML